MIPDMQRLENAARLSMGDFEGPSVAPRRLPSMITRQTALFMLAAVALVIVAVSLLV